MNANCPKDKYMFVRFASYNGLPATKRCGLSNDYICQVDVTCVVKKKCDDLHECNLTVDGSLISPSLCPGLSNYLYFEYECLSTKNSDKGHCGMHSSIIGIVTCGLRWSSKLKNVFYSTV